MRLSLFLAIVIGILGSGPALADDKITGDKYDIYTENGVNTAGIDVSEADYERTVFVVANIAKTNTNPWFHAQLLRDGVEVRETRVATNHEWSMREFDIQYQGIIKKDESPTFIAGVKSDAKFNPQITGVVSLTVIVLKRP